MREMTTRQWLLIARMQIVLNIKFKGSTMDEASTFIKQHLDAYMLQQEHDSKTKPTKVITERKF